MTLNEQLKTVAFFSHRPTCLILSIFSARQIVLFVVISRKFVLFICLVYFLVWPGYECHVFRSYYNLIAFTS